MYIVWLKDIAVNGSLCYPIFQRVSKPLWQSPVVSYAQLIKTRHCIYRRFNSLDVECVLSALRITNRKIITDRSCQLSDLIVTRLMCKCEYTASPNDFLTPLILCLCMPSKTRRACMVSRFGRGTNMLVTFQGIGRKFCWENWEKPPNAPVKKRVFELDMSCYRCGVQDTRVEQQRIESRQSVS